MKKDNKGTFKTVIVPIDWELKKEIVSADNGSAEQQIADEENGIVYFD